MSLEDLAKASQRMTEKDFPQFDDPRVREVFAAAANLVEELHRDYANLEIVVERRCDDLETALFAAQHSKPKVWPCPTKPGKTCMAAKCDWGCKT